MPELPEVEAARRSLARTVAGKTIARVVVRRPTPPGLRRDRARRALSRPADVFLSALPAVT